MSRYARAPSPPLLGLLAPGALLAPLLKSRIVAGCALDVQFREDDTVTVYCGRTALVRATLVDGGVRVHADPSYMAQRCGQALFRDWRPDEPGFEAALETWLDGARIDDSFVTREGALQAAWATCTEPWSPIDREAVLGYEATAAQAQGRDFRDVKLARAEVASLQKIGRWSPLPEGTTPVKLDLLAVDGEGRLVLMELKDTSSTSAGVYYAPLQLLQYLYEWQAHLPEVRADLDRIVEARKACGLAPRDLPLLSGVLRPVIGMGRDGRSVEVRGRFQQVLTIANRRRPRGTAPIEVWSLVHGKVTRLAV